MEITDLLAHEVNRKGFRFDSGVLVDYLSSVRKVMEQSYLGIEDKGNSFMQDFYWEVLFLADKPVEKVTSSDLSLLRRSLEAIRTGNDEAIDDLEGSLLEARNLKPTVWDYQPRLY